MRSLSLRTYFQLTFLLLVLPVIYLTNSGCYCGCGSGSDYPGNPQLLGMTTRDTLVDEGIVSRYHDAQFAATALTPGELDSLRRRAGDYDRTDFVFGLLVPQAPGSPSPGVLVPEDDPSVYFLWSTNEPGTQVTLTQSVSATQKLSSLYPPPAGSQWQALVPGRDDFLDLLPSSPFSVPNGLAYLNYQIDFQGADPCNGCKVEFRACGPLRALGGDPVTASAAATPFECSLPVISVIHLKDTFGNPLPGPLTAAFGFWGGSVYAASTAAADFVPVNLEQSGVATETFTLEPITSQQGWSYSWTDTADSPLSQIDVAPFGDFSGPPNLRVHVTGLPACAQIVDTVYLTATHVTTPTIQAFKSFLYQSLPNPDECTMADVGVVQVSSARAITGGNAITFTQTVSNHTGAVVSAFVTQTLSSAVAVAGATLPAECTHTGAIIACQVDGIPPQGAKAVALVVQISAAFAGDLFSTVEVQPIGAVDGAFLDNTDGPLGVAVAQGSQVQSIYLPTVVKP